MKINVRKFKNSDLKACTEIWNEVVREGNAFPQTDPMTEDEALDFFLSQTLTGTAEIAETGEIVGLYILHPNNVGRCGHISNASYAVKGSQRGCGIGRALVCDCIKTAPAYGYKILQFNAVVATNIAALSLYKSLGFIQLGVIPKGFKLPNGDFEDIIPHYITLE